MQIVTAVQFRHHAARNIVSYWKACSRWISNVLTSGIDERDGPDCNWRTLSDLVHIGLGNAPNLYVEIRIVRFYSYAVLVMQNHVAINSGHEYLSDRLNDALVQIA